MLSYTFFSSLYMRSPIPKFCRWVLKHSVYCDIYIYIYSLLDDSINTFRGNGYVGNNWTIPVAMQRAVNTTIEEEAFSLWFAYIHYWATDVFSMRPPRDYTSSPVVNQKSVEEREWEWSESSGVKEEKFDWGLSVSYCNWLRLREIVQEDATKSNHPIQNPLLLVTEP
jgi:hypothetical protein